jgi:flagellar biosynthesis/type III secretory pathway M-ring protein FliF/YscJ
MLFVGTFLLWSAFAAHPLFFAIYWLLCAWLVICVLLVAIYDLLMVMRRGREEHAEARKNIFRDLD